MDTANEKFTQLADLFESATDEFHVEIMREAAVLAQLLEERDPTRRWILLMAWPWDAMGALMNEFVELANRRFPGN